MAVLGERVTRKIVYEKASPRVHRAPSRSTPDMNVIRSGRETLRELMPSWARWWSNAAIWRADLHHRRSGLAAQLSALDYLARRRGDATPCDEGMVCADEIAALVPLASRRPRARPTAVAQYAELDF